MDYKSFPPELRANLSGNHGRNRKCSFSTNTSRISGLPKKWQTGGREKCHSAAEPIEFLKVWLIRIPRFCVDDSNSVPNLPLPMKNIGKKTPGSSIHKLYDLRSPNSQPSELGNLTKGNPTPNPSGGLYTGNLESVPEIHKVLLLFLNGCETITSH